MDPFSVVVGTMQIAQQCAIALVAVAKYIKEVTSVDDRLKVFHDDLTKLKETYDVLRQCCNSPLMMAGANRASEVVGHLWSRLRNTLQDCENTLVDINKILREIADPFATDRRFLRVFKKPIEHLRERLSKGTLERHHSKIKMFHTSLALPMQMINITLQLDQRELDEEHHRQLGSQLRTMQRTIASLHVSIAEMRQPQSLRSPSTAGSSALVRIQPGDRNVCDNMEKFAFRARQFLSNASTIASTISSATSSQVESLGDSATGIPLTTRARQRIHAWVPAANQESDTVQDASEVKLAPSDDFSDVESDIDQDFQLDLVRKFYGHGQQDISQKAFVTAEANFSKALGLLHQVDFGDQLAFSIADVKVMLAQCYIEQDRLDGAIALLLPLTHKTNDCDASSAGKGKGPSQKIPKKRNDHASRLAAHHSLGRVYLKKNEYENAIDHGSRAFHGRRRRFGPEHESTSESVQLLIDIYSAQGDNASARVYMTFTQRPSMTGVPPSTLPSPPLDPD